MSTDQQNTSSQNQAPPEHTPEQSPPSYRAPAPPPAPPQAPPRKSPGLAVVLSFFPGMGHIYLGQYQRGIAFFVAFAASIFLADTADLGIAVPFVFFFAIIDAYRQAQFINLGVLAEPETRGDAAPSGRSTLGFGIFLTVIGIVLLINQFYPLDFYWLRDWWPLFLVLAGIYMIVRTLVDQQKAREEARRREEDEYGL